MQKILSAKRKTSAQPAWRASCEQKKNPETKITKTRATTITSLSNPHTRAHARQSICQQRARQPRSQTKKRTHNRRQKQNGRVRRASHAQSIPRSAARQQHLRSRRNTPNNVNAVIAKTANASSNRPQRRNKCDQIEPTDRACVALCFKRRLTISQQTRLFRNKQNNVHNTTTRQQARPRPDRAQHVQRQIIIIINLKMPKVFKTPGLLLL